MSEASDLWSGVERAEQAMSEFGVVPEARTVCIRRVLPGPIERVWAYLTESEKRGRWLASGPMELHVELTPHAEPTPEKYKGRGECASVHGRITRCDAPRLLSYTWGGPSGESEVTFELTPQGEDVMLVLTHRRLGNRGAMVSVAGGWHTHLGILLDQLEGREPRPFWSTFEPLEAEYERRLPPD
jgi:uncharacterized protein YndB with AHSA1/START domain